MLKRFFNWLAGGSDLVILDNKVYYMYRLDTQKLPGLIRDWQVTFSGKWLNISDLSYGDIGSGRIDCLAAMAPNDTIDWDGHRVMCVALPT